MKNEEITVFCFGVNGYRDEYHSNYHPASLYRRNVENPYGYHGEEEAEEMIGKAFDSLPKKPEEYTREESGSSGWVRFEYDKLVSGENIEPIMVTE